VFWQGRLKRKWSNKWGGRVNWITPKLVIAHRNIARKPCLAGWNDPNVDTFQLVSEWLCDDAHRLRLLVLDNADDMEIFFSNNAVPVKLDSRQGDSGL
jgi:hypothetical protein